MTEGRFETIHNLRPKNWDYRRHWTNWHHLYDCEADHLARESCPFHDLRAGGQFQYENWGGGPYAAPIEPQHVNNRANGDRMDFSKGNGTNLGGWGDIPLDTESGRPTPQANTIARRTAMFTKKNPLKRGLFSEYPYMPEGEPWNRDAKLNERAAAGSVPATDRAGGFKAGGPGGYLGQPFENIPDPFNDKIDSRRRYRFRVGPVPRNDIKWMPEGEPDKKIQMPPVKPFYAGKYSLAGISLGGDPEWIADPYNPTALERDRRPFRTWYTRTKWSMPTHAPWSTGLSTAEPRKGATLELTDQHLPNLATSKRVDMKQSIGSEAARSVMLQYKTMRLK